MSEGKILTKKIAEQFLEDEDTVDLSKFKRIMDEAAEILSKHEGELDLSGLTELSDAAAESLSKHKGGLEFGDYLETLSDSAAESLSKHKCKNGSGEGIYFSGLRELSERAIQSLSKHSDIEIDTKFPVQSLLRLKIQSPELVLTKEVAEKYRENSSVNLHQFYQMDDDAAVVLGDIGDVHANSIESLSDLAAAALANPNAEECELCLSGLHDLSDRAVENLSKFSGSLLLGLTELSDAAAESLSNFKGSLVLSKKLKKKVDGAKSRIAEPQKCSSEKPSIPSSPPQGKGGKAKKTTDSLDQGGLPQSILDLYN